MPNEGMRESEYVLAPGEFCYLTDQTNGKINTFVGPLKISLAGTDQPIIFNSTTNRYERVPSVRQAVCLFSYVDERSYCILHNPSDASSFPKVGTSNPTVELKYGSKINVKGPATFPLWPGQSANVISGHQLKSNQYLIVKVYNADKAKANFSSSVIETVNPEIKNDSETVNTEIKKDIPIFVTGQLLIIKGTEISFYIPPTGIEVVPADDGKFIRDAVTLERMDYCILLNEGGEKRYVRGPSVVFPSPTENFIELNNSRKFRAIELNPQMGIHIKVIADYEENGKKYKAGDELHITGDQTKIYFPRAEHALIKYGDQIIQYAVAITSGEGRYVFNKEIGDVETIRGPKMLLPNPINQVIVNRVLSDKEISVWFPGNNEAILHNQKLRTSTEPQNMNFVGAAQSTATTTKSLYGGRPELYTRTMSSDLMENMAAFAMAGDQISRKTSYTPPRSIQLNTKYDGAVRIDVWPGFAVQTINKIGERKAIIGPKRIILEYDETLEILGLSRGKPKDEDVLLKTPYLQIKNNKISDVVNAKTKDLVDVSFLISYSVNFENDPTLWFTVNNYVKLLTDHMRSIIRNAIQCHGIEEINNNHVTIIRDIVLGTKINDVAETKLHAIQKETESKTKKQDVRAGRLFPENGMRIYDVEIFSILIGDETISKLLIHTQHQVVETKLQVIQRETELETRKKLEDIARQIAKEESLTSVLRLEIQKNHQNKQNDIKVADIDNKNDLQKQYNEIAKSELARTLAEETQKINILREQTEIRKNEFAEKMKAVSPDLIAAIQNAAKMDLAGKISESLPPASGTLGLLAGAGGIRALAKMFEGTPMEDAFKNLGTK